MLRLDKYFVIVAAALLLPSLAAAAVVAENAWIPLAPPGTSAYAGYLRLVNRGDTERKVVGVSSDAFAQVMIHRTVQENGTAKMEHMDELTLPVGIEIRFEPGGLHVMFVGAQQSIDADQNINVTLELDDGSTLEVPFVVRPR